MSASWALTEALFQQGEPLFVQEICKLADAERLGKFAEKWYADRRPIARQWLRDYLSRPLKHYRHEALIKRLFKLVWKAQDDELLAYFAYLFDRSIRRTRQTRTRYFYQSYRTRAEVERVTKELIADGFVVSPLYEYNRQFMVQGIKRYEVIIQPHDSTLPRDQAPLPRKMQRQFLFKPKTRRYLRRRAWRYFRQMGKTDPLRYRQSLKILLPLYAQEELSTDLHLLDSWSLMHALFHHASAVQCDSKQFQFRDGQSLNTLQVAPYFESAWQQDSAELIDILLQAKATVVQTWAAEMLQRHHPHWLQQQPLEHLFELIQHANPTFVTMGFTALSQHPDLHTVPVNVWLKLLESDSYELLRQLSDLLYDHGTGQKVALADCIRLALHRSYPVARIGFHWLQQQTISPEQSIELLPLANARCETIQTEIAEWLRSQLKQQQLDHTDWIVEFLDSSQPQLRKWGWDWLLATTSTPQSPIWLKLLESPYPDLQLLVGNYLLQQRSTHPVGSAHFLWATLLLRLKGTGRSKPKVVQQLCTDLIRHPDGAEELFPLLSVLLKSLRSTEFRAGLFGIVQLYEQQPVLRPKIEKWFPDLQMAS